MKIFTVFITLSLPLAWASPQFHHRQVKNFTVGQVVETSSGPVAGHAAARFPEVSEYLGIPFAQPPVGDLRFAAPVKYTGSSLLNGSTFSFSCPNLPSSSNQTAPTASEIAASNITAVGLEFIDITTSPNVGQSEDCLYLNVWSKPQSGEALKAVMVFLYGGDFVGGSASLGVYNGDHLVEKEDVVIVNLNYRLSILGFPGNPDAQGNLAFLDQRLAMEWVRDNILSFGGDPARITLFGQSAGSSSTDYYAYAWTEDPIAAGIILESGTTFSFGLPYSQSQAAANWYGVATNLGCGNASTDSTTVMSCMRNRFHDSFRTTVDNTIVFANYSEQTPASIPVLVGNDNYEAGLFRTELALTDFTVSDQDWDEFDLAVFTCPAGMRANASVAANNPTWRYRFFGVFPNINISSEGGAYHGSELQLLFGTTDLNGGPNSTAEEINFERYLQGAWTTFAKDPVNGLLTYEGGWPLYDPTKETLIRLGYDNLTDTNLAFPMLYDAGCPTANLTALEISIFG